MNMEKIFDSLQFALACLVGATLFALGVREIRRSGSHGRFFST